MMKTDKFITKSDDETIKLGEDFAQKLDEGDIVAFYGGLGSGKTEFIKGICRFFDVKEMVNSPTFTIINSYIGEKEGREIPIYHIDLYRIKSSAELDEIGFAECLDSPDSIKLIEWAEKANGSFPLKKFTIRISFDDANENERLIEIEGMQP